jgi:hypothetical protein
MKKLLRSKIGIKLANRRWNDNTYEELHTNILNTDVYFKKNFGREQVLLLPENTVIKKHATQPGGDESVSF